MVNQRNSLHRSLRPLVARAARRNYFNSTQSAFNRQMRRRTEILRGRQSEAYGRFGRLNRRWRGGTSIVPVVGAVRRRSRGRPSITPAVANNLVANIMKYV